ncbi:hypothetical protein COB64_01530, partial [Candidatus Wolfebacteria bacterium]
MIVYLFKHRIYQLKKLEAELKSSNSELEQFAYRSSHDLKSPLSTIKSLAKIMLMDLESGDVDEVKLNLKKVINNTGK